MTLPHAEALPSGGVRLSFPYSADLVADLKDTIPASARSYDPRTRTWTVWRPPWTDLAVDLLLGYFPDADAAEDGPTAPRPIRPGDPDYRALHLLPSAPPELVAAAYRALARRHHPDAGGDHESMLRITAAFDALRAKGAA